MIAPETSGALGDLGAKLVSADQALAVIEPGRRIYLGTGCAAHPRPAARVTRGCTP
jgi:hypothetical protein